MPFSSHSDPVFEAIKAHLTANWDASDCPIAWPNEGFVQSATPTQFLAVEITSTSYDQQSIGEADQADNRWDEDGRLWVHVMVKRGSGASGARGAGRAIANLFRGTTLLAGQLEFMEASIGLGQPGDEQGNYYRVSVDVEWRYWDA